MNVNCSNFYSFCLMLSTSCFLCKEIKPNICIMCTKRKNVVLTALSMFSLNADNKNGIPPKSKIC